MKKKNSSFLRFFVLSVPLFRALMLTPRKSQSRDLLKFIYGLYCIICCRYVKTYLLPDRTKNGKRKTRVKKHTLNPIFDEVIKVITCSLFFPDLHHFISCSCPSSRFPIVWMRPIINRSAVRLLLVFFISPCCWPFLSTFHRFLCLSIFRQSPHRSCGLPRFLLPPCFSLPRQVQSSDSFSTFRSRTKTGLFCLAY